MRTATIITLHMLCFFGRQSARILRSKQVLDRHKVEWLASLARSVPVGVRDDVDNAYALSRAAFDYGANLDALVVIDVGAHRYCVSPGIARTRFSARRLFSAAPIKEFRTNANPTPCIDVLKHQTALWTFSFLCWNLTRWRRQLEARPDGATRQPQHNGQFGKCSARVEQSAAVAAPRILSPIAAIGWSADESMYNYASIEARSRCGSSDAPSYVMSSITRKTPNQAALTRPSCRAKCPWMTKSYFGSLVPTDRAR